MNCIFLGITICCGSSKLLYLRVCFQNTKCSAREYFRSRSYPSGVIPLLYFPVTKYFFAVIRPRGSTCRCFRTIDIGVRIRRSTCTIFSCIVFHYDTGSSFQSRMPLRVDVQLLGNPETIFTWCACIIVIIPSSEVGIVVWSDQLAVYIISIRHIGGLIVRCCYIRLINGVCFTVKDLCKTFIEIPAIETESCQISTSRFTDMSTFTDTEGHRLILRAPIDITSCTFWIINVKEHTVLLLTPFCVDRNTAFRHCSKYIRLCTSIINIPAFKHITCRCLIIRRFVCVI